MNGCGPCNGPKRTSSRNNRGITNTDTGRAVSYTIPPQGLRGIDRPVLICAEYPYCHACRGVPILARLSRDDLIAFDEGVESRPNPGESLFPE